MTLFQEIDRDQFTGGLINGIEPESLASEIDLRPGDILLAINDQAVEDVIDVQYYASEEELELLVLRGDELLLFEALRAYQQPLGLVFSHPTFDTDIRRCNNLCEFCFVLQMAPRFRRTLYIKDDDYRYSFLFGHYVTLTNLSRQDWQKIETMRLTPLYVSVHVTDLAKRRQYLRNESADDIVEQLHWLTKRGIEVHTQIVVTPDVNDGPWLKQSIKDLAELWPGVRSISVVPVGLTKHHKYGMRANTKAEANRILDYIHSLQPDFQKKFGVRFVYATDEWYLVTGREVPPIAAYDDQALTENGLGMVRHFLDDWAAVQNEITKCLARSDQLVPSNQGAEASSVDSHRAFDQITLVTGSLFEPVLKQAAGKFSAITGVAVDVVGARNLRLGDSITVAGLLMAEDVIAQLDEVTDSVLIVLPRVMFDHPDHISLDDWTVQDVANRLQCPVALADTMGDVWDALTGTSLVMFQPMEI